MLNHRNAFKPLAQQEPIPEHALRHARVVGRLHLQVKDRPVIQLRDQIGNPPLHRSEFHTEMLNRLGARQSLGEAVPQRLQYRLRDRVIVQRTIGLLSLSAVSNQIFSSFSFETMFDGIKFRRRRDRRSTLLSSLVKRMNGDGRRRYDFTRQFDSDVLLSPLRRRFAWRGFKCPSGLRAAKQLLEHLELQARAERKKKMGRANAPPDSFDLLINSELFDADPVAALIETAARERHLAEQGPLSTNAESQIQFQVRLQLARHGVRPPAAVTLKRQPFSHPSEAVFANPLDFYRIAWEYEPRSFSVQWDADGGALESFTPDF